MTTPIKSAKERNNEVVDSIISSIKAKPRDGVMKAKREHRIPGMDALDAANERYAQSLLATLPSRGTRVVPCTEVRPRAGFNRLAAEFTGEAWDAFVSEVFATGGNHTPVVVEQVADHQFRIIDGERRWRACEALALPVLIDVRVAETPEQKATVERMFITANEQRADRSYASKCLLMAETAERMAPISERELAERVGLPYGTVATRLLDSKMIKQIEPVVSDIHDVRQRDLKSLLAADKKKQGVVVETVKALSSKVSLSDFLAQVRSKSAAPVTQPPAYSISVSRRGTTVSLPTLDEEKKQRLEVFLRELTA